ncbi:hypothetical protein HPG69_013873 [Diceros bicornis minor]|uniref:Uncharacterized protein n=1 Tax=Diceros bicornis minor TaxID=77932 RepID=A0A7J7EMT5_DICBM|nr:hypothetical protein HPG69_013873 [Diceros bicornis minor]
MSPVTSAHWGPTSVTDHRAVPPTCCHTPETPWSSCSQYYTSTDILCSLRFANQNRGLAWFWIFDKEGEQLISSTHHKTSQTPRVAEKKLIIFQCDRHLVDCINCAVGTLPTTSCEFVSFAQHLSPVKQKQHHVLQILYPPGPWILSEPEDLGTRGSSDEDYSCLNSESSPQFEVESDTQY